MELSSQTINAVTSSSTSRKLKYKDCIAYHRSSCIRFPTKPKETLVVYGLPETAASVAVAATVVGAAATFLARRTKSEETTQAVPTRTCDDCGGSGICPECKGEGFVLKRLSDGSAEKARLNAKNMATRYTAGHLDRGSLRIRNGFIGGRFILDRVEEHTRFAFQGDSDRRSTSDCCYAGFYPKLFSIKIHHGGAFSELPGHTYEDGQVNLVDLLNVNNFSVVQLDEVRVKLGYQVDETSYYHLLVPGGDLDTVIYKTNDYMAIVPYNEVEELTSSKQLEGQQYKISQQMLNDFNPFLEIDIEFEDAVAEDIEEVDDHNKGVGSDETNSDYIVDMINDIDDVEVDIRNFKLHVDEQVEKKIELDVGNDINDEVLDNDNFESGCESNENIGSIKKRNLKSIKRENEKYFYIGQAFGGKNEVKQMIKTHSVESRRQLKIVKDDNYRVRVICAGEMLKFDINEDGELVQRVETEPTEIHKGSNNPLKYSCPWLLLISKDKESGSWMVKTFIEDHKCIQTCKISACISSFLSQQLMEQIEENPNIPVKAMQEQLKRKFEVEISKMKAFRAKGKALLQIQGDYSLQYMLLRDYIDELKRTNPGTTVIIEVETATEPKVETRRFKRIYICLGPLKEGFKAIGRDILGLDGSFMKGPYPGQILTAVGIDNNNGIYPLSYAIVEEENYDSWSWFIRCVGDDLNLSTDSNFTFVSDRQKVYSFKIFPINGKSLWPRSVVPTILTPPTHHKPVGRPKKARKKSAVEIEDMTRGGRLSKKNTTVTCDKCRNKGHNRRICNGINQA
ncbi:hypothetical protein E3N88_32777 [Mikania micrantha]|uniref:Uncharacterized protein n=1 Tax=Mikania micrantha TaxID=192012 RepID=A0A5N6M9X2_9ASTR|nr:hypothetical protein E3N88_32777 [Mikania micrantha]